MDRILHFLYDEETPFKLGPNEDIIDKKGIADVIDDVYRLFLSGRVEKTEASGSGTEGGIDIGGAMPNEDAENVFSQDMLIHCPCTSLAAIEFMIQKRMTIASWEPMKGITTLDHYLGFTATVS